MKTVRMYLTPALVLAGLAALGTPERAAGQDFFAGAGLSIVRPFYDNNPAYAVSTAGVGSATRSEDDLDWNLGVAPKVWVGFSGETMGFRASYFLFDHSAEDYSTTVPPTGTVLGLPSTAPAIPLGVGQFGALGTIAFQGLGADQLEFKQDLGIHTVDLEFLKDLKFRSADIQLSAGGRYMHLEQDYRAKQSNAALGATESQTVTVGREFNGGGPTAALTAWNPFGSTGLSFYGSCRTTLLVGTTDQKFDYRAVVNGAGPIPSSFNSFTSSSDMADIIPTVELAIGLELNRTINDANFFGRVAVVDQTYFGAGNPFSDEGNMSLFGLQTNFGFSY